MAAEIEISVPELLQRGWGLTPTSVSDISARWFTGKTIVFCDAPGGPWCLAGSPEAFRERVAIGARFQEELSRAGCSVIPRVRRAAAGDLLHGEGGRVWCLTTWVDGRPEHSQERWTPSMLQGLGAAVGELHRIGRGLVPAGAAPQPAPEQFWAGDWSDFDVWAAERWQSLGSDEEVRTAADLGPLRECIEIGLAALPVLRHPEVRDLTIAHDDLWTEHVLFDGHSRLVGIIDLDGLEVGDGVGDLAALLSDFARLWPVECSHVLRGYRTQVDVDESDLEATLSSVIRHHLLTLLERIRLWQEQPERRHDLIAPVGYWLDSLRSAVQMDKERWVSAVWSRSR